MAAAHNSAIKRLLRELKELIADTNHTSDARQLFEGTSTSDGDVPYLYSVTPLEDNFFDWHFTIKGPDDSPFATGVYHGRIEFPPDYPFSPPNFMFLTPNGRFDTRVKICLSVTTFHKEAWQPVWGVRTMLLAIREHFRVEDKGAIGYVGLSEEDRRKLAEASRKYQCSICEYNISKSEEKTNPSTMTSNSNGVLMIIVAIVLSYLLLRFVL